MCVRDRRSRVVGMTRKLLLIGACAASFIAPAAADARTVVYDVVVEGSGKFHDVKHIPAPREFTQTVDATVGIQATIPQVAFVDGRLDNKASGPSIASVTATSEITAVGDDKTMHQRCESLWSLAPDAEAHIESDFLQPLENAEPLHVRAADTLDTDYACSGDHLSADESVLGMPAEIGEGAMDASFTIPRDIIGHGKIIQLVKGAPEFAWQKCPGQYDDLWTCTGGWEGTVTFTKVSDTGAPAPAPAPAPATKPAPAPIPAPKPFDDADDLLAPLVPAKAAVDAKGATASFTATCPTSCSGTATFTSGGSGGKARAAAAKALGTAKFTVKAGAKQQTVKVKLPAKARKALKRTKTLKMALVLKPKAGKAKRATLVLKLPRR
jgi:hypothetical protein